MSAADDLTQFDRASTVLALAGPVVAVAGVLGFEATAAFRGSVAGSAVVALVFAGYGASGVLRGDENRPAAATVAAVFGVWLVSAPLLYGASGAVVGAVQTGGLLLAAFEGYLALVALFAGR
ncbi:MAG: hypothetical protein ABEJ08_02185 [Halobacteriaceae archaeon]